MKMTPQLESNPSTYFFSIPSPLILEDCKETVHSKSALELHSFVQNKWLKTWKCELRRDVKITIETRKVEKPRKVMGWLVNDYLTQT